MKNVYLAEYFTTAGIMIVVIVALAIGIYDVTNGGITPLSNSRFRAEIDYLKLRVERLEKQNR